MARGFDQKIDAGSGDLVGVSVPRSQKNRACGYAGWGSHRTTRRDALSGVRQRIKDQVCAGASGGVVGPAGVPHRRRALRGSMGSDVSANHQQPYGEAPRIDHGRRGVQNAQKVRGKCRDTSRRAVPSCTESDGGDQCFGKQI